MIPILFSKKVLKDLNSWLSSFIWSKRKPWWKMTVVCRGFRFTKYQSLPTERPFQVYGWVHTEQDLTITYNNALRAWWSVCQLEGRLRLTSVFIPILTNPCFPSGILDVSFQWWHNRGVTKLGDVFSENCLSFKQLKQKYQFSQQDFFWFLQIRHYILRSTNLTVNLFWTTGKISLNMFTICGTSPTDTQ